MLIINNVIINEFLGDFSSYLISFIIFREYCCPVHERPLRIKHRNVLNAHDSYITISIARFYGHTEYELSSSLRRVMQFS
jgi:hypothetical protein